MQIKVYGNFQFCDNSANCCENGELAMLYDVPKSWKKWDEEKREEWLEKNYDKIDKAFNDAMCVVFSSGYYEDY
ncbi:hypothetical protein NSB24_01935 [Blautia coccoides]|uniref:hypothetical protein n=1 Tax=Lachnospiraceae TaxID=186803 RepID=UPI002149BA81|nr:MULTISPECIES: hypothetical protein [Lachnospiraceae]MCR1984997.1 hypothetical protein [Blautia coccoides]MCU0077958.1 hypothetical protein [Extibacter muris]